MGNYQKTYWSNKIELDGTDLRRLKYFIGEELSYYNALVAGLAGPMRSMPEAVASLERYEGLMGEVARSRTGLASIKKNALPANFKPFEHVLFDEAGRIALDGKALFLAEVFAKPGTLNIDVRRNMAISVMRETRRHSKTILAETALVEALEPIEPANKRHVQIPRSAIKIVSENKEAITLKLPYFEAELTIRPPSGGWNYAYVRVDFEGIVSLDLTHEENPYALRKQDRPPYKGKNR